MLRPDLHQKECLRAIKKARDHGGKKALVVMASGTGKTLTVAWDVERWIVHRPKARVLYLCHQKDILEQARATFESVIRGDEKDFGYYHGLKKEKDVKFMFASFQTMRTWMKNFNPKGFDYIVVDESHHAPANTYQPIVEYFNPKFLLGITATPEREDLRDVRSLFGREEIYSLSLEAALARGILTPVDYRVITDEIVELGEIENPYRLSLKVLNKKIFVPRRDEEIARIIEKKVEGIQNPKIMIFCSSIRHAEMLHAHFPYSLPVHSRLPHREQNARIRSFREGIINTILSIDKFNEGLDIPEVNVVVFLRTTQSNTVFYQQLGRGLRKVPGKKKVLILDFVANCERIEMISELVEKVIREQRRPEIGEYIKKEHLTVDIGKFSFTETAKNILEILRKSREGYTKEVLIQQLLDEAKRLGRVPSITDIDRSSQVGRTASPRTFKNIFGSWQEVMQTAGLTPVRITGRSKETLLQQYKAEAERLKRAPRYEDIREASKEGRMASPFIFIKNFGSINKVRALAGFKPVQLRRSKETLLQQYKAEAEKLGRAPNQRDMERAREKGRMASRHVYARVFGSMNKVRELAGFKQSFKYSTKYSKETLLQQYKAEAERLGRMPTRRDIDRASKEGRTASSITFHEHFGGMKKLRKVAGLLK